MKKSTITKLILAFGILYVTITSNLTSAPAFPSVPTTQIQTIDEPVNFFR